MLLRSRMPRSSASVPARSPSIDATEFGHPAGHVDAEHGEQLAGEATGGDAGGRLAGAGPFEHGPNAAEVLDGAGQVDMAGPRPIDLLEPFELRILVDDLEGEWAAERHALPEAGEKCDGVGFDPLPSAAAVASLTALQFGVDRVGIDGEAGGKSVDEGDERGAVGFTGGPVAEHDVAAGARGNGEPDSSSEKAASLGHSHQGTGSFFEEKRVRPGSPSSTLSRRRRLGAAR